MPATTLTDLREDLNHLRREVARARAQDGDGVPTIKLSWGKPKTLSPEQEHQRQREMFELRQHIATFGSGSVRMIWFDPSEDEPAKRKRGRPKGSKNKP